MSAFRRGGLLSIILGVAMLLVLLTMGITQETPLGSVDGSVRMGESGLPLPGAAIIISPVFVNADTPKDRVVFSDKKGEFFVNALPAGEYKIEASAKAHTLPATQISVREGAVTALDLELKPKDPELRLYTSQRVFMPDETPQVEARGFGRDQTLNVEVYKIDVHQFLAKGSVQAALNTLGDNYYGEKQGRPEAFGEQIAAFDHKVQNADAEGTFMDVLTLDKLGEGFYWIQCKMGNLTRGSFISVSRIALVTKSAAAESLCYVTDLKTGHPVAGAVLQLGEKDKFTAAGKTNSEGLATIKVSSQDGRTLVMASFGASQALSSFYSRSGGDEGSGAAQPGIALFAYTDRPIYRPGDDIQFKGFVRKLVGSDYKLPGAGQVTCEVRDADYTLVKTFTADLKSNGSFTGHYPTADDSSPGDYSFKFKAFGQQQDLSFTLAAYRKPEFTIKVSWSRPRYTMGEKAKATVKCEYYFGGPVAGAKVTANIYRNQDWGWDDPDAEEYQFESESYDTGGAGGEFVENMEGVTDANGEATFEFVTKRDKEDQDPDYAPNYTYTLTADVAEAGDKYFSGEGSVKVTQGDYALAVEPDVYIVAPGQTVNVSVKTFKHENKSPYPNRTVELVYGIEKWTGRELAFIDLGRTQVRTGPDGKA
ncbi:MAG: alpha-2-macroglobulin, partial [Fimbriimonadaceae bacterium]|nr:alpha-2-macroglobulin [Fimbriimonadaceae bacterium]